MDTIVASIQALSGSASDLNQLLTTLKGANLANHAEAIPHALQALDAHQHSLGTLWLLEAASRGTGQQAPNMAFIDTTARFFRACQPAQVRISPDVFTKLARKFREVVMSAQCPRKGILPLLAAIRALQPTSEHLTPIHAEFLMLCLASKCYNAASQLLSEDIFFVDPSQTACVPRDLFLYCRYGSMICTGRKQWPRAVELHMCAIAAPSLAGNAIVLDCYKQYVLISLISQGSVPSLPKVVSSSVKNMVESDARVYNELATAYSSHNVTRLSRIVEQHTQLWTTDGNLGLVGQVLDSLIRRNIQRLTSTYLTLSLADIAGQVGLQSPEQAEYHILRMIASGEIFAVISEADGGMVRFYEDPELFNSTAATVKLERAVEDCIALAGRVASVNQTVATSKEYLRKVLARDKPRFEALAEDLTSGDRPF